MGRQIEKVCCSFSGNKVGATVHVPPRPTPLGGRVRIVHRIFFFFFWWGGGGEGVCPYFRLNKINM